MLICNCKHQVLPLLSRVRIRKCHLRISKLLKPRKTKRREPLNSQKVVGNVWNALITISREERSALDAKKILTNLKIIMESQSILMLREKRNLLSLKNSRINRVGILEFEYM